MSSDSSGSLEQAIMGDYIPLDIIQSCERDYRKKLNEGQLTDDVKFTYSWHLIKSRYKDDIKKGIKILGDLCQDGYDQRDYLYFMGMGYYKLEVFITTVIILMAGLASILVLLLSS
jgi:fission 1 protein